MRVDLQSQNLNDPVAVHARKDFPYLQQDMTVAEALTMIRQHGVGERIIYFYVVDAEGRLVGVMPTRRLLTADLDKRLYDIMITRVVSIPHTATVLDACEFFVMHKFFAFPVVDEQKHIVGVVDIQLFTEEVFDLAEREQSDAAFEALGFRISQIRDASPAMAVRFRFPWLLATIGSGVIGALLTSVFEATLAQRLVLAFFLALVLGLGESVSIQSMSVAIQTLRISQPTLHWYVGALKQETLAGLLLGGLCGLLVAVIVWAWHGPGLPALVIGAGITCSLGAASALGLSIPALLHALRLDPKIASGPLTLGITDIVTLLCYLTLAAVLL